MGRNSVSPARWSAFEILRKVEDGAFSSVLLAAEEPNLEPADRALCHELVLGVLRRQLQLDKVIEHFSNRNPHSLDRSVVIALRLGLYQLRFLTKIPASAAVNESVKLVHAARLSSARAFVNAILRRATREMNFNPATAETDPISKLSIESSHPRWLIERWIDSFGLAAAEEIANANNLTPPIAFRVVQTKANDDDILAKLCKAGVSLETSNIAEGAWLVSSGSVVLRELVSNGEIYLQDEASQLVAEVVGALPGERVLDVCAAPGGKSTLIADRTKAFVVAGDVSPRRLSTIARTVATQELRRISLLLLDASHSLPFPSDTFDRVLVDAPCSGTGTLRHNPEIRWRVSEGNIRSFAALQIQFLENGARVVRTGGRLVYSTCSVEKEENEEVISRFLRGNEAFRQVALLAGSSLATSSGALRTWPQRDNTDGFFVAALEKVRSSEDH